MEEKGTNILVKGVNEQNSVLYISSSRILDKGLQKASCRSF
jgi:hypothetical protein